MSSDAPNFSRSANIFGCLDDSIDFRINGDMKIELFKKARAAGYHDASEYLRKLIAVELYGVDHVVRLVTDRVLGIKTSVGQTQDESFPTLRQVTK